MKHERKLLSVLLALTFLACGTVSAVAASSNAERQNVGTFADADTSSATVFSYSADGKNHTYSMDDMQTWMTEAEYQKAYPTSDIVWWTYDEYKAWLDNERTTLPALIGQEYSYRDADGVLHNEVWTQERVNAAIARYEQTLDSIRNGAKVSKTVDGDDSIGMIMNPSVPPAVGCSAAIEFSDGNIIDLGLYDTKGEVFQAVKDYCDKQVETGNMTRQEADKILSAYEPK